VPVWETSPVGPFDAWPTGGGGFEYFYGFIGGEASTLGVPPGGRSCSIGGYEVPGSFAS
jgi:hypothetical protein